MQWFTFSLLSPANAGINDFSSYFLGTLFIILLPGPNSLFVLTTASQKGWRSGVWGAMGIFIGDCILMIGVALGAASLLLSSPILFNLVRTVGASYLGWMGSGLIRTGWQRWTSSETIIANTSLQARLMQLHPLLAALALSLTNPKAIFFFIAFFSQFIQTDFGYPAYTFLYLALVLQLMSMSYLAALILVGQKCLHFFKSHHRAAAMLWMIAGAMFVSFAVRLLLT
ncbi:leucine efflux protein LeuE [Polynucleobacter necessarius]|uniref:leucine efflux protein LeuE n=1 Tax=Polynucleobacter necessarius TaxID=576610 RepID=UPI000E097B1E|nr:leucine efflux protein LeuE [Polynucleobacter necessarius]